MEPITPLALPDKVYFRIGEVAKLLEVQPHVVRFWQKQFRQVKPERSKTGRFLYTAATVQQLHVIRTLLYVQGFTIPGAKRALKEGVSKEQAPAAALTRAHPKPRC